MSRTARTFAPRLAPALLLATTLVSATAFAGDGRDIDKVNGGITAEAGQQYGSLETVNGGIDIGARAQTGNAETVNGGIDVADGARTGDLTTVNGGIQLGSGVVVDKDLETVNGQIFVDHGGRIGGDVTTVNGAIGLVETDVGGGIDTVNGDITVGVGSHVHGGVHVEKNNQWLRIHFGKRKPQRVIIGPNAVVDGPLLFERPVVLYVSSSARVGKITGATPIRFDGAHAPTD
jgi:DUF4097 and DUF4098 domain-containing protein YvlB